jgi:hypothetical protein
MELFCFASKDQTNIWAGIGAGMWAVNETSPTDMKARITKSKRLKIGSFGILYCNETHSFTTPFVVLSEPDPDREVNNIWQGKWRLPFFIHPLGNPSRQVTSDEAKAKWDILRNAGQGGIPATMHITGTTVFVPVEIPADDWAQIVASLSCT